MDAVELLRELLDIMHEAEHNSLCLGPNDSLYGALLRRYSEFEKQAQAVVRNRDRRRDPSRYASELRRRRLERPYLQLVEKKS